MRHELDQVAAAQIIADQEIRLRITPWSRSADSKLPIIWAERADAWLEKLEVPHETKVYSGDHGISPEMARDFLHWQDALLSG